MFVCEHVPGLSQHNEEDDGQKLERRREGLDLLRSYRRASAILPDLRVGDRLSRFFVCMVGGQFGRYRKEKEQRAKTQAK